MRIPIKLILTHTIYGGIFSLPYKIQGRIGFYRLGVASPLTIHLKTKLMAQAHHRLETKPRPERRVTLDVSSVLMLSGPGVTARCGQRRPLHESPNVLSAGRDLLNRHQRPNQSALNGDTCRIPEASLDVPGIK